MTCETLFIFQNLKYECHGLLRSPRQLYQRDLPNWILCRGGKTPRSNECPIYDTKQSECEALVTLNTKYPLNVVAPRSTLARRVAPYRVLSMGHIGQNGNYTKLNCLKLTIFTFNSVFKLRTYAKLNCLK